MDYVVLETFWCERLDGFVFLTRKSTIFRTLWDAFAGEFFSQKFEDFLKIKLLLINVFLK